MLKRTPLFEAHKQLGGKLIEFGGWEMPVQYSTIIEEHTTVRKAAGIFDISHMGEISVSGKEARAFLNWLLTNDLEKLSVGLGQYSLMCNEQGGTIDDLYVYRLGDLDYLLIVNASRIEPDIAWIEKKHRGYPGNQHVRIENISDKTGAAAVQGPAAASFIDKIIDSGASAFPTSLTKNQIAQFRIGGALAWVSRTGYTGEDGFEIIVSARDIEPIWNSVLEAGRPFGIKPAGLGARDTLRTEVCYPLYGHELDESTGPIEAGLGFFVSLEKGGFIGRPVLVERKIHGPARKLVAFKTTEKSAPPRPGYTIWTDSAGGEQIGTVVSGTLSPSLGVGIGMAYLKPEAARVDSIVYMETRGRRAPVLLCKKPLYRKPVDRLPSP